MTVDKSPIDHRYSPPGWEGRNYPLSMEDRNPWANLSEHSYSSRHLNRARHMDPKASSTRDRPLGCLAERGDDLRAKRSPLQTGGTSLLLFVP